MQYKIDKDVPQPKPRKRQVRGSRTGLKSSYPFVDMLVGDSFVVPFKNCASGNVRKQAVSLNHSMRYFMRQTGTYFILRQLTDERIFRIWRVSNNIA